MDIIDNNKKIGQRIKNIRVSLGKNMDEFGKLFFPTVTKGTISKWENGKYLPNSDRLQRIASLGDVSVEYLLDGTSINMPEIIRLIQKLEKDGVDFSNMSKEEAAELVIRESNSQHSEIDGWMSDAASFLKTMKLKELSEKLGKDLQHKEIFELELIEQIIRTTEIIGNDIGLLSSINEFLEYLNTLLESSKDLVDSDTTYLHELTANILLAANSKK